ALHGGTVCAFSEGPDRGSEIVVCLPVIDRPALAEPVRVARAARGTPLRILAVDDNVELARGLEAVLGLWGHTVRTAHDGLAALELATTFAPEVVLLDL